MESKSISTPNVRKNFNFNRKSYLNLSIAIFLISTVLSGLALGQISGFRNVGDLGGSIWMGSSVLFLSICVIRRYLLTRPSNKGSASPIEDFSSKPKRFKCEALDEDLLSTSSSSKPSARWLDGRTDDSSSYFPLPDESSNPLSPLPEATYSPPLSPTSKDSNSPPLSPSSIKSSSPPLSPDNSLLISKDNVRISTSSSTSWDTFPSSSSGSSLSSASSKKTDVTDSSSAPKESLKVILERLRQDWRYPVDVIKKAIDEAPVSDFVRSDKEESPLVLICSCIDRADKFLSSPSEIRAIMMTVISKSFPLSHREMCSLILSMSEWNVYFEDDAFIAALQIVFSYQEPETGNTLLHSLFNQKSKVTSEFLSFVEKIVKQFPNTAFIKNRSDQTFYVCACRLFVSPEADELLVQFFKKEYYLAIFEKRRVYEIPFFEIYKRLLASGRYAARNEFGIQKFNSHDQDALWKFVYDFRHDKNSLTTAQKHELWNVIYSRCQEGIFSSNILRSSIPTAIVNFIRARISDVFVQVPEGGTQSPFDRFLSLLIINSRVPDCIFYNNSLLEIQHGNVRYIDLLCPHLPDLNGDLEPFIAAQDEAGNTVLHRLAKTQPEKVVSFLGSYRTKPYLKILNHEGDSILHICFRHYPFRISYSALKRIREIFEEDKGNSFSYYSGIDQWIAICNLKNHLGQTLSSMAAERFGITSKLYACVTSDFSVEQEREKVELYRDFKRIFDETITRHWVPSPNLQSEFDFYLDAVYTIPAKGATPTKKGKIFERDCETLGIKLVWGKISPEELFTQLKSQYWSIHDGLRIKTINVEKLHAYARLTHYCSYVYPKLLVRDAFHEAQSLPNSVPVKDPNKAVTLSINIPAQVPNASEAVRVSITVPAKGLDVFEEEIAQLVQEYCKEPAKNAKNLKEEYDQGCEAIFSKTVMDANVTNSDVYARYRDTMFKADCEKMKIKHPITNEELERELTRQYYLPSFAKSAKMDLKNAHARLTHYCKNALSKSALVRNAIHEAIVRSGPVTSENEIVGLINSYN